MSVWKGGVWGSQKFPGGSGVWKGGAWASQRRNPLAIFAANGFTPGLAADFQQESGSELYSATSGKTDFATMFPSFARASDATYVDSSGNLQTASTGVPRRNHHVWDGTAWVNRGLLYETESRTNLLLNSDTLATQNVTVTAEPHTIHFTGTGSITLSGAATGTLTGTGTGEGNRASLTFTPTAGTLTITVSGTATNGQLEVGQTPSSYIPTAGATVTRAAESGLTIPSSLVPWSSAGVSIAVEGLLTYWRSGGVITAYGDPLDGYVLLFRWRSDVNNFLTSGVNTKLPREGAPQWVQKTAGTVENLIGPDSAYSPGVNVPYSLASRHTSSLINGAHDGTTLTVDTTPTALADLSATDFEVATVHMGTIGKLLIFADDIGDAGIVEASS